MKVNKETLKIDITTLTQGEAEAFIECLEVERIRHTLNIYMALSHRDCCRKAKEGLKAVFWATAIKRHEQDIKDIDTAIAQVKEVNYE